jgi:hypothetical protein
MYDVTTDGGKYRFILDEKLGFRVLRNGEPWWVPKEGSKAIISLLDGEERRQKALAFVKARDGASIADDRDRLLEILDGGE